MEKQTYDENKITRYSPLDAFKIFFWSMLLTQVASFVAVFVLISYCSSNGVKYEDLLNNRWVALALLLIYPIVLAVLFFKYHQKRNIDYKKACELKIKFDWNQCVTTLLLSLTCLFLVAPFINLLDYLYKMFGYAPNNNMLINMTNPLDLIISLIAIALIPAVIEELIFRGLILRGLLGKFKPHVAIILSAAFFMLIHGGLQQTVYQFILGLLLGYVTLFAGLQYSMLLHFLNNAIVLIINYFTTATETAFPMSALNVIVAIFMFALAVTIFVFLLKYMKIISAKIAGKNKTMEREEELSDESKKAKKKDVSSTILNKYEVFYLTVGVVFAIVVWLVNTLTNIT